jgi:hypothetical protein
MTATATTPRSTEARTQAAAAPAVCVAAPIRPDQRASLRQAAHGTAAPVRRVEPAPARPVGADPARPASATGWRAWDEAAWAIATDGITAHEQAVTELLAAARSAGVCSVLVDVLADPAEPTVARERAFGRVAAAIAQH